MGDFELRFSFKLVEGASGSGVLYRGWNVGRWQAEGYHAEFVPAGAKGPRGEIRHSGFLSFETGADTSRGSNLGLGRQKAVIEPDGKKRITGSMDMTGAEIQATVKDGDWNEFVIIAQGPHLIHEVNNHLAVDVLDNCAERANLSGFLGLALRPNRGRNTLVYFKDIRLRRFSAGGRAETSSSSKWTDLFDGQTLSGWRTLDNGDWSVASGGIVVGRGQRGHLFSPDVYTNFEFKAEAKLNHGGNSGMFFRAEFPSDSSQRVSVRP